MEHDALVRLVRTLTREAFASRFRELFLVVDAPESSPAIGFETRIASASAFPRGERAQTRQIIAVKKAEGNPYPDRISVGRARNRDVVLREPSVSKLHAHFVAIEGKPLELVDLGSHNGTLVGGRPLTPNVPQRVGSGDVLRFGGVEARLVDAARLYDQLAAEM